ncbi:23S rRNA (cytidine(2498)-2'-O)-methyltransferase RlmM [Arhodomonas aquaeolei]|uniref:23S rRNA (cytidine(2498)-2'-O)-methyltransferase RlmM n=1 Tax=Arhodomonas aquaeolei TaxID=2369 RepID=UPI000367C227|nr:23S rRNA (cytidine(2498)-2'-O)-methyltransferase RlmM [Arhodomonas aquaeolei]
MTDTTFLLYVRPGFEGDLAAELTDMSARIEAPGYCEARPDTGFVLFHAVDADAAERLWTALDWRRLIFARQWLRLHATITGLPGNDRAGPIAEAAEDLQAVGEVWLEYPDTNAGKALSRLCRGLRGPLQRALRAQGVRTGVEGAPRLHVFLTEDPALSARVALSRPGDSAPWPLGIPRLRMPRDAPSRSTLKLDEAIQSLMRDDERARWLRSGARAVDLGAAPGGWSWQLARRGLHVTAVDNGPMAPSLLADGMVEHVRADGFRYRPERAVDWVVCDIVEQPHRVAALMAAWLDRGDAQAAIFNLKLPMKRRYQAVTEALATLRGGAGRERDIAVKHLYHDREEVTVRVLPARSI